MFAKRLSHRPLFNSPQICVSRTSLVRCEVIKWTSANAAIKTTREYFLRLARGRGVSGSIDSLTCRTAHRRSNKINSGTPPDTINYQLILTQHLHLFEQLFYVMGALPSLCAVIALPSEARRQLNPVNKLTIKQYSAFTYTWHISIECRFGFYLLFRNI